MKISTVLIGLLLLAIIAACAQRPSEIVPPAQKFEEVAFLDEQVTSPVAVTPVSEPTSNEFNEASDEANEILEQISIEEPSFDLDLSELDNLELGE